MAVLSVEGVRKAYQTPQGETVALQDISFAMEEMGEGEIEIIGSDEPALLGDIIISIDRMEEQAAEYGHSNARELGFLAVHGFLHLLGYDHMNAEDEKVMFTRQRELLDSYGLTR